MLANKKTYLAAAAMITYAVSGVALQYVEPGHALEICLQAAAIIALRIGIAKAQI
jgi:hypothetical protein